jgi:hypothetical protein
MNTRMILATAAMAVVAILAAVGMMGDAAGRADLRAASACSGMTVQHLDEIATRGAAESHTTVGESRRFLRDLACAR